MGVLFLRIPLFGVVSRKNKRKLTIVLGPLHDIPIRQPLTTPPPAPPLPPRRFGRRKRRRQTQVWQKIVERLVSIGVLLGQIDDPGR